jgi:hypothetical protein
MNKSNRESKNPVRKILILASNPNTTPKLRLDEEVREVQEGLQRSKHRDQFEIQSRWAVRLRDLRRALLDIEPQLVHFTGHGKEDGLLVEDELGMAVRISAKALAGLFELCSDQVECVILSACYSAPQATAISKHINYVIGMKEDIDDKAAIEFAVGFYDALGAGKSVEKAFKFGRNAILQIFPDLPEHLIPIMKKRKSLKKQKKQDNEFSFSHEKTGFTSPLKGDTIEYREDFVVSLEIGNFVKGGNYWVAIASVTGYNNDWKSVLELYKKALGKNNEARKEMNELISKWQIDQFWPKFYVSESHCEDRIFDGGKNPLKGLEPQPMILLILKIDDPLQNYIEKWLKDGASGKGYPGIPASRLTGNMILARCEIFFP